MKCSDKVLLLHTEDIMDEGFISLLNEDTVMVDFLDWIELFDKSNLSVEEFYGNYVIVTRSRGKTIRDYRNASWR